MYVAIVLPCVMYIILVKGVYSLPTQTVHGILHLYDAII